MKLRYRVVIFLNQSSNLFQSLNPSRTQDLSKWVRIWGLEVTIIMKLITHLWFSMKTEISNWCLWNSAIKWFFYKNRCINLFWSLNPSRTWGMRKWVRILGLKVIIRMKLIARLLFSMEIEISNWRLWNSAIK